MCDALSTPGPLGPVRDLAPALGLQIEQLAVEGDAREQVFRAVLAVLRGDGTARALAHAAHLGHLGHQPSGGSDPLLPAVAAVGLHSLAMLTVAGVLTVAYQKLGFAVLRRAWLNLDLIWAGTLVVAGGLALGLGL